VPCSRTVSEEVRDAAGNPLLDATTGKPLRRSLQLRATFFKPVPIYDISQTEGRAIPEFATELQSTQLGCAELMDAVRRVSTAPIGFGRMRGGVQGSYSPSTHRITVKSGLSEAMTLKTMLHEVVHSRLHRTPEPDIRPADILKSLRRVEIEAEATSFIVLNAFEIDVASYSFDYICSWSASQELRELHEALDTIRRESGILIEELEEALEGDEPIAS
jgi:hypothetical protein